MLEIETAAISQLIPEPPGKGRHGRDGPLRQGWSLALVTPPQLYEWRVPPEMSGSW